MERGALLKRHLVLELALLNTKRIDAVQPIVSAVEIELALLKMGEATLQTHLSGVAATTEQGEKYYYIIRCSFHELYFTRDLMVLA